MQQSSLQTGTEIITDEALSKFSFHSYSFSVTDEGFAFAEKTGEASGFTARSGVEGMQLTVPDFEQPHDAVDEAWTKACNQQWDLITQFRVESV